MSPLSRLVVVVLLQHPQQHRRLQVQRGLRVVRVRVILVSPQELKKTTAHQVCMYEYDYDSMAAYYYYYWSRSRRDVDDCDNM